MDPRKKRPMAAVRRISLFRREIRESIPPAGVELLLDHAARISEGQVAADGRYYGSTMLTIALEQLQGAICDSCDVSTAEHLARLLEAAPEVQEQTCRLALAEACRIAGRRLQRVEADMRVRWEGTRVFVDIDVEGHPMAVPFVGGVR